MACAMKCRLLHPTPKAWPARGEFPAGHIIDHRQAPILVQMGAAESADEECAQAVNRTPEQLAAAQRAYTRVRLGIHPHDFEAFDEGRMAGYNQDGSWKPGPNYEEPAEDNAEEESEEESE